MGRGPERGKHSRRESNEVGKENGASSHGRESEYPIHGHRNGRHRRLGDRGGLVRRHVDTVADLNHIAARFEWRLVSQAAHSITVSASSATIVGQARKNGMVLAARS